MPDSTEHDDVVGVDTVDARGPLENADHLEDLDDGPPDQGFAWWGLPAVLVAGAVAALGSGWGAPRRDHWVLGVILLATATWILLSRVQHRLVLMVAGVSALAVLAGGVLGPDALVRLSEDGRRTSASGLGSGALRSIWASEVSYTAGATTFAQISRTGRVTARYDGVSEYFVAEDGTAVVATPDATIYLGLDGRELWRRPGRLAVLAIADGIVVLSDDAHEQVLGVRSDGSTAWSRGPAQMRVVTAAERAATDASTDHTPTRFWAWAGLSQEVYDVHAVRESTIDGNVLWTWHDIVIVGLSGGQVAGYRGERELWRRQLEPGVTEFGVQGRWLVISYNGPSTVIDVEDGSVYQVPLGTVMVGDCAIGPVEGAYALRCTDLRAGKARWTIKGDGQMPRLHSGAVLVQKPLSPRLAVLSGREQDVRVSVHSITTGRRTASWVGRPDAIVGLGDGQALVRTGSDRVLGTA